MWCEKIVGVVNNHYAIENNHIIFIHILQYFLIAWGRGEMIGIKRRMIARRQNVQWISHEQDIFGLKS
jgi:hypothetical protein